MPICNSQVSAFSIHHQAWVDNDFQDLASIDIENLYTKASHNANCMLVIRTSGILADELIPDPL